MRTLLASLALVLLGACATPHAAVPVTPPPPPVKAPEETHLGELLQLTFGGENAEAYWSFDGDRVSLQARPVGDGCDRIYSMQLFEKGQRLPVPVRAPVSSGQGATTCAHYLKGDQEILYASTHSGGPTCPARPDMSLGYVWALYDTYDIYASKPDGSGLRRLTDTRGYDAEATVCPVDGSIIFTSVRDGDIELYRMDADGKNVKRLTFTPGYDGGAFFSRDCKQIVWRASRPRPGKELEEFQALLAKGLVKPSKLELFVANADGSEARQVTYLDAATFAPYFFPDGKRIIFSSNYGDPKGREFDLWAVDVDGTHLERITWTKGFDGFPMFSPDGQWLIFASNRMTAPGAQDTNLFLARWVDHPVAAEGPAERTLADVTWLADPAREGRGVGTPGLDAAGAWLEERFKALGLEPLGTGGSYRVPFKVTTSVKALPATRVTVAGAPVASGDFVAPGWSGQGSVKGQAVLAGWALQDQELGFDDFKGLDVKGKVVVARRFVPDSPKLTTPEAQRKAGDLRKKAFVARALGARALVVVDWPVPAADAKSPAEVPPEAALPALRPEGSGDSGLPVVVVKRAALQPVWKQLEARGKVELGVTVALAFEQTQAFNVVGRIPAGAKKPKAGALVVGAHYDHLGYGGPNSLTPDRHVPHPGADDNASGTATLLEVARTLSAERATLTRDVVIASFSGEEEGVLGSSALVQAKPAWLQGAAAMLNLDMVGRLRANTLSVLGTATAPEWMGLVEPACAAARVSCTTGGDGYGPSDHMPFYTAGLPVLFFFTGAHGDYHKPSDLADKLNAVGMAKVAEVAAAVARATTADTALTYSRMPAPAGKGDARSYNASLGTVPNYGGPPAGVKGVLLDDVRPGGGAEKAGMRRGDVIVKLGTFEVGSVEDLMFVLMQARPGETVTATVLRDGKKVELETTYQEGRRR